MRTSTRARAGAALAALSLALTGCSAFGVGDEDGDTLTFQSLAFQDTTIKATKDIVDAWNKKNPDTPVKIVKGSWDNVHDQLVTQFKGGTAPDIIHDESADIMGFAEQGYLADLGPHLSDKVKSAVSDEVWKSVTTEDDKVVAAPTLLQSYVVFANTDAFADADVKVPTGEALDWDDLQKLAKKLTADGDYGVGWGMKDPTATVMNLALNFDGTFFSGKGDKASIDVGDNELEVPERIHSMAFKDKSLDPKSLTQSGSDVLPGFFDGKYSMYVAGNYVAQQIVESAPKDFKWEVLPPLAGTAGASQAANPQTMSVSAESDHVDESAKFIDFFMRADHQAALAEGDWLIPSSKDARKTVATNTKGANGWESVLASGDTLTAAPFQSASKYPQWKDQFATPALQDYLADKITAKELKRKLVDGWSELD
ncbi:ABC transporter substrate-binding protein [Stackebrandtia nassauensis]|uniref:Extracellular solute-binding protein family 1 n=1 Tax=Stackebrandtia nassauensis (strain DSM 44728 / CIP 108903 / NRRL B-16338 / NBRC 102104 / LLR-40K-21) TaxID=446470 RepID=D3Q3E1_STANL|nr:extracellular solute-binding protein [Stackebrandtia nassauensis]ADD41982.1 extracellular solute-binding protein family 1 [Stackebrandtia nassauensis DSM 44728]